MKRAATLTLGLLFSALLAGCDAGKEPLARAAAAEAAGDLAGAATLYREVCEKGSSLCPTASRQAERIKLAEARKALDEGAYHRAKRSIDAALTSTDSGVKRAAEAMSKLPDLETGLIWEDATAMPNPNEALAKFEIVADAGVSASPRAQEWLTKNRPRILLERAKAACVPASESSCVDAGRELAARHPGSPESAEAQKLVEADYARIFPLLGQTDRILALRQMLHDNELKAAACKEADESSFVEPKCDDRRRAAEPDEPGLTVESLNESLTKLLEKIHDPHFVKRLKESWSAAEISDYAPETWPRPSAKK